LAFASTVHAQMTIKGVPNPNGIVVIRGKSNYTPKVLADVRLNGGVAVLMDIDSESVSSYFSLEDSVYYSVDFPVLGNDKFQITRMKAIAHRNAILKRAKGYTKHVMYIQYLGVCPATARDEDRSTVTEEIKLIMDKALIELNEKNSNLNLLISPFSHTNLVVVESSVDTKYKLTHNELTYALICMMQNTMTYPFSNYCFKEFLAKKMVFGTNQAWIPGKKKEEDPEVYKARVVAFQKDKKFWFGIEYPNLTVRKVRKVNTSAMMDLPGFLSDTAIDEMMDLTKGMASKMFSEISIAPGSTVTVKKEDPDSDEEEDADTQVLTGLNLYGNNT